MKRVYCYCCDTPFVALRSDALTCSAACRQMVSRAKRSGVQFAPGRLKQPGLFGAGSPAGVKPTPITKRGK